MFFFGLVIIYCLIKFGSFRVGGVSFFFHVLKFQKSRSHIVRSGNGGAKYDENAANFTSISPVFPGIIGSFGFLGIVQPQLELTFEMISGSSPVFVNSNTRTPSEPFSMVP